MAAIDIVILILLGLGAYEGYRKGLLLSIVGLIGFVLAIILGVYFMDPVSKWLATKLDELTFAFPIMAFLIVFAITLLFVQIVGWILKKLMDLVLLGGLDSLAGALLGIVKRAFFSVYSFGFPYFLICRCLKIGKMTVNIWDISNLWRRV